CCWKRSPPSSSSPSSRWLRSRFISAPMPRRRSPAPFCRSTAAGRPSEMALFRRRAAAGKAEGGPVKKINLALQGGGAHGAFTWGVLDRLLADGRFHIEGVSGTSAGAVNAVMLADGLARGGPEEARKRLADFWRATSRDGNLPSLQRAVVDRLFSFLPFEGSPAQAWF